MPPLEHEGFIDGVLSYLSFNVWLVVTIITTNTTNNSHATVLTRALAALFRCAGGCPGVQVWVSPGLSVMCPWLSVSHLRRTSNARQRYLKRISNATQTHFKNNRKSTNSQKVHPPEVLYLSLDFS